MRKATIHSNNIGAYTQFGREMSRTQASKSVQPLSSIYNRRSCVAIALRNVPTQPFHTRTLGQSHDKKDMHPKVRRK